MEMYEPHAGEHIDAVARKIQGCADKIGSGVGAMFNGIAMVAKPGGDYQRVVSDWWAESNRRQEEYRNSPEGKAAALRAEECRRVAREAEAVGILPFSVKDKAKWDELVRANNDPYGAAVIRYAARWANYMEQELHKGAAVRDVAKKAKSTAELEGITGFQFHAALQTLVEVWEYGADLAMWHMAR